MRRKKIWVVTLMAFMVLALPALAQKGKKPKKGKIPVTVTFRDCTDGVPSVAFALLHLETAYQVLCPTPDDRIKSDCKMGDDPTTCPYTGGIGSANGNFRFGVGGEPKARRPRVIRELFFDFTECVSLIGCNLPELFMGGVGSVGEEGAVNLVTHGIDLRDMSVGEEHARDLELSVGFDLETIDQGIWRLDFRPNDIDGCEESSSSISVTRTADDTWEIEAGPTDIACLLQPGEKVTIAKFSGLYHMPFKITLV